ncbi:MAG: glucose 1-dehydrogenase [Oscillospiraceae bacterium]|nr:glucose 1-dehydrogenase [Oscillospiraceae bacterium]
MFSLKGKDAIVVGGGGGIGQAIAKGLAMAGANVSITSRGEEKLLTACAKVKEASGGAVTYYVCDVSDEADVEKMAEQFVKDHGKVDILVNSQGYNKKYSAFDHPMDEWDRTFEVNVKSILMCCKYFGRYMRDQKGGRIINVSSIGATRSKMSDISVAYGSSKGAVNGLTINLAAGWGQYGITVNALCPIMTETEMMKPIFEKNPELKTGTAARVPVGRIGLPEDNIAPAVFFASDEAAFINGQIIYVDGGLTTLQ